MPATVPFAGPKKRTDESPRGKEDPNSQAGSAGCGATGRNWRADGPDKGAQDVSKAHEAKQTTKGSSTGLALDVDACSPAGLDKHLNGTLGPVGRGTIGASAENFPWLACSLEQLGGRVIRGRR